MAISMKMMMKVNLKVLLSMKSKKIKTLTGQILMERKVVSMLTEIRLKRRRRDFSTANINSHVLKRQAQQLKQSLKMTSSLI